jgi:hypothetical protein
MGFRTSGRQTGRFNDLASASLTVNLQGNDVYHITSLIFVMLVLIVPEPTEQAPSKCYLWSFLFKLLTYFLQLNAPQI